MEKNWKIEAGNICYMFIVASQKIRIYITDLHFAFFL